MSVFVCIYLLHNVVLLAQQSDTLSTYVVLTDTANCMDTKLDKIVRIENSGLVWDDFRPGKEYWKDEFGYVQYHFESKAFENVLSSYLCVLMAAVLSDEEFPDEDIYVEIYEIRFPSEIVSKHIQDVTEKYKINRLDWPDASIPIRLYRHKKAIYLFLDSSDEPNAISFNRVFEKVIGVGKL